ncbi:MAG: AraC family transcriptional regulator [Cellulomonadaceae bacterium]|jgi:AraC-like DNA-binding protein|nr:AraC family transcriptional regulator [Cellulomonadaceae bacterium]
MDRRRTARFGAFVVAMHQTGPWKYRNDAENFGHPWRALRFVVVMEGGLTVRLPGSEETLTERCAALTPGWLPMEYETNGATLIEVDIAVERTPLRGSATESLIMAWDRNAVIPSITASALRELVYYHESTAETRGETNRVVENLVLTAVAGTALGRASDALEHAETTRIVDYINAHFQEHDLTPAHLAHHFGVSTRTLHRLFQGQDTSLSGVIASKRLDVALQRLNDPRSASIGLEDVAASCGYGSALAMRRAVVAATGQTPSDIRSQAHG